MKICGWESEGYCQMVSMVMEGEKCMKLEMRGTKAESSRLNCELFLV